MNGTTNARPEDSAPTAVDPTTDPAGAAEPVADVAQIYEQVASHSHRVLTSSKNPNWRTPKALFDKLAEEFPIAIDLAADADNSLCEEWLGPSSQVLSPLGFPVIDALAFDEWAQFIPQYSYGYLNPPYSRELKMQIEPWIQRCYTTALVGRGVIAVLPAAIQTDWWRTWIWEYGADEVRFIPHRVSFDAPPGVEKSQNANVNSAVVIWKPPRPFVGPWTPHIRYWSYR